MPNNADNISTSTNSGPQQGSGTGGIAHVTGEGAFNFGGSNNTMPNTSTTSFKDLIDIGFRKTLEGIGFMKTVIERIEVKQNITIDYLKESLEGNKKIDEKVDDLRRILSRMEDDRRKAHMNEELKRREEELEKLTKPTLVSGREDVYGSNNEENKSTSAFWYLALPIAAGIIGQIYHAAPVIRGFLEFVKGTEKLIGGLAGAGASGASAGMAAASKFKSIFDTTKTGLMSTASGLASGAMRASMVNVLKWLNVLKNLARKIIILDAFWTIVMAEATADDPQAVENRFMRVFGKIAGGTGGAWIIGSLLGLIVGSFPAVGVFIAPIAAIAGAIIGGYYGTIVGEDVGRALYKWFASDLKDVSGFTAIWTRIRNDLATMVGIITPTSTTPSKPSGSGDGSSGAGWDREAQKRRDEELKRNMDALTKPSVGGSPAPSTGGVVGGGSSYSPSGDIGSSPGYSGKGPNSVGIDPAIDEVHDRVAKGSGVSINLMRAIGDIESSNNPNASTGSYHGVYQLKGSKDLEYQIQKMISNILYYKKIFYHYMKREPSGPEIYMTHQQGPLGGPSLAYAYFNGMQSDLAAVGMSKASAKLGTPLSVETFTTNIKGNLRWSEPLRKICEEWDKKMPDSVKKQIQSSYKQNEWNRRYKEWANLQATKYSVTVKDFYEGFVVGVGSRLDKYNKKDPTGAGTTKSPSSGKAPVSAGMTPVSYSSDSYSGRGGSGGGSGASRYEGSNVDTSGYSNIPSYGSGGSNTWAGGTRYDKTLDKNHPALDILVSMMYKKGQIPSGSVVSFNDDAHSKKSEKNHHRRGLAVDISQAGGNQQTRNSLISAIKSCGREYGVDIAAEDHTFAVGTGSTGQHVHAYFRSIQDADTFLSNWLKKNGIKGKSPSSSSSSGPEVLAFNPSSGQQLMSYGMGEQKPKVVQITQPIVMAGNEGSSKGRSGSMAGPIPSAFNPSNRDILNTYL